MLLFQENSSPLPANVCDVRNKERGYLWPLPVFIGHKNIDKEVKILEMKFFGEVTLLQNISWTGGNEVHKI